MYNTQYDIKHFQKSARFNQYFWKLFHWVYKKFIDEIERIKYKERNAFIRSWRREMENGEKISGVLPRRYSTPTIDHNCNYSKNYRRIFESTFEAIWTAFGRLWNSLWKGLCGPLGGARKKLEKEMGVCTLVQDAAPGSGTSSISVIGFSRWWRP